MLPAQIGFMESIYQVRPDAALDGVATGILARQRPLWQVPPASAWRRGFAAVAQW